MEICTKDRKMNEKLLNHSLISCSGDSFQMLSIGSLHFALGCGGEYAKGFTDLISPRLKYMQSSTLKAFCDAIEHARKGNKKGMKENVEIWKEFEESVNVELTCRQVTNLYNHCYRG